MLGRDRVHPDHLVGIPAGGIHVCFHGIHHRQCAEENGAVVEQAVRPSELEEGIAEHHRQSCDLELEDRAPAIGDERELPEHGFHLIGGAEQGEAAADRKRSEEHTSELQSLMRTSYAVFCLKKKNKTTQTTTQN